MASKRKIGDAEADVGAASGAPRPQFETRRAAFKASYEELNAHFARHVHARVAKQEAGGPVEDLEPLCDVYERESAKLRKKYKDIVDFLEAAETAAAVPPVSGERPRGTGLYVFGMGSAGELGLGEVRQDPREKNGFFGIRVLLAPTLFAGCSRRNASLCLLGGQAKRCLRPAPRTGHPEPHAAFPPELPCARRWSLHLIHCTWRAPRAPPIALEPCFAPPRPTASFRLLPPRCEACRRVAPPGGMHAVALSDAGDVFTWGCNDEGAVGRELPPDADSAGGEGVENQASAPPPLQH